MFIRRGFATTKKVLEPGIEHKVVPTATTFFRLSNPELFADPNKSSSWRLVYAVWGLAGGYLGYLLYLESNESQEIDAEIVGPRKRNGRYS